MDTHRPIQPPPQADAEDGLMNVRVNGIVKRRYIDHRGEAGFVPQMDTGERLLRPIGGDGIPEIVRVAPPEHGEHRTTFKATWEE